MPDIAQCKNKECTKRLECYRYMAHPGPYQYYMNFAPDEKTGVCADFWDHSGRKIISKSEMRRLEISGKKKGK